jgi:hypothetical protein
MSVARPSAPIPASARPPCPGASALSSTSSRPRACSTACGSGLLSGICRQPLLCEDDLLARILTGHELGEVAETYLMGHGQ